MARQLHNRKWNPVIFDNGFVGMMELKNREWKLVECDTKEEAEQKEKEYYSFWQGSRE